MLRNQTVSRLFTYCTILCLLVVSAGYLRAEVMRDQYFAPSTGWSQAYAGRQIAQSFYITLDGFLESIDLHVNRQTGTLGTMLWDIRPLINGLPSASSTDALVSGSIAIANLPRYVDTSPISLDISDRNIRVRPGDEFAIVIGSTNDGAYWLSHGSGVANHGKKYERPGNDLWRLDTFSAERPRAFATYFRLIPEPSSLLLIFAGMGAVLLKRAR